MVFAAGITQRGHKISTMEDLMALYEQSFSDDTLSAISNLPHSTVQKFALITVAIVGASRRFLAQITRHQNEVKFMSASLQYSNYAGQADFAIPYEVMAAEKPVREIYLKSCQSDMGCYEQLCNAGLGHDAAGYATPQGLRNVLIISATPYQWKHIIGQRVCRRNTDETRIVLLKIWGYEVYVGKVGAAEVDFIAIGDEGEEYYQVAYTVIYADGSTLERELAPLDAISDHNPKYLLTMDFTPLTSHNGIKQINVLDWLLE